MKYRAITTDAVDIKNVIREYYEQLYANTFENQTKWNIFRKRKKQFDLRNRKPAGSTKNNAVQENYNMR